MLRKLKTAGVKFQRCYGYEIIFIGKYEIKLPIIQGGMGVGVSLNGLASAVANEGGVGVISAAGLGLLYPEYRGSYPEKCIYGLGQEIRKAREKRTA